jgi:TRAP-type mannitol/chloroaromatic compound transport system permease large subunit
MPVNEVYAILMVCLLLAGVIIGFPVAFMLGALGVLFGVAAFGLNAASYQAALATYGVMSGWSLLAIPLFVSWEWCWKRPNWPTGSTAARNRW